MANDNKDFIYGVNIPRMPYAISGRQFGPSTPPVNGKMPSDGAPILISMNPPGEFSDSWSKTYGASIDSYLTIINGFRVQESIDNMSLTSIFKDGSVNADDDNIWKPINTDDGIIQQVQYLASKDTIEEASESTETYGNIDEVRGLGIRLPMMAGGWGRTIDGLPTDPQPTDDSTGRKNDDSHKLARETWKFGPIEARWDYRKGVWTAYNEMIADHNEIDIGTWVFGTNTDSAEGFPFLRGRLEDVWWIRKPFDKAGTNGALEGIKTGEIMTHLEHRLFDNEEEGAAPLNTVFIIPHKNIVDEQCHEKGEELTVGSENTGDGASIDIRTTVHFWKEDGIDGPLRFGGKSSEEDVCCEPAGGKYFLGKLIFLDVPPTICADSLESPPGGIAIATEDSGAPPCVWAPAVKIDECELVGEHFIKLVENDIKLGIRISQSCNAIADYTESLASSIDGNFAAVDAVVECLNRELGGLAAATEAMIISNILTTNARISLLTERVNDALQDLASRVRAALFACGCDAENVVSIDIQPPGGIVTTGQPGKLKVDECDVLFGATPSFPCDNCYGTKINGPCLTQPEFTAGEPCSASTTMPALTSKFGNCQIHET